MPTVPLAKLNLIYSRRDSYRRRHEGSGGRSRLYLGGLIVAALIWFGVPAFFAWQHTISSSGGRYFVHRVVIPVPVFSQDDQRWDLELLGPTYETLGQAGCAVTSAAMVLAAYGVDTDPDRLNQFLDVNGGYTPDGQLFWEKAAEVAPFGQVEKAYEDPPSYALIDHQLLAGNPVIVRLTLQNGRTHFVVIVGKEGWDYLVQDPARSQSWGVYPLRDLTSRIEALRYYKVVPPHPVAPYELPAAPAPAPPMPVTPAPAPETPVAPPVAPTSITPPAPTSAVPEQTPAAPTESVPAPTPIQSPSAAPAPSQPATPQPAPAPTQ